ncbi:MAG: hypothetical protein FJX62_03430 [Alphaproteobacteria bacterium]|nr:hypothetical protein [Alphaproteobacteria bacterium]
MRSNSATGGAVSAVWHTATATSRRRVVAVCLLLGSVLAIGAAVRHSSDWGSSGKALTIAHPDQKFRDGQIGEVLFSPHVGDNCKRALFDNRTGAVEQAEEVNCVQLVPEAMNPGGSASSRIESMRRGFKSE